jgi:serine protease Do
MEVAGPAQSTDEIGITVQSITPQLADQFHVKPGKGVVVTEVKPGSIAAMAGIEMCSIILQVNRQAVKDAAEFKRAIQKSSAEKSVLLLVKSGDMQRYFALNW